MFKKNKDYIILKFKELFRSPHIHIALATAISIIALAFVSKRVLPEPIGTVPISLPPLIMVLYELLYGRFKNTKICTTWYWVVAILITTALVIVFHVI